MSSAKSSIDSLLKMTMDMIKKGYETEKKSVQKSIDKAKEKYDKEKKHLESIAKEKKKQYDEDKKQLEHELDGYRKKINAQLELLKSQETEHDYQNELAEKQKEVADLIADNDDPRSAMQIISDFINSDRSISSLMSNTMGTSFNSPSFNVPVINPMSGFDLSKLERVNNSVGDITINNELKITGNVDKETQFEIKKRQQEQAEFTINQLNSQMKKGGVGRNMRDYT